VQIFIFCVSNIQLPNHQITTVFLPIQHDRAHEALLAIIQGTFARIGTFTFGGGYAMIPLIEREVVEKKK